jgi:hypothetical protein
VLALACLALLTACDNASAAGAETTPTFAVQLPAVGYSSMQSGAGVYITLHITPDKYGPNSFLVELRDPGGAPISSASITLSTRMQGMDMGISSMTFQPASVAGVYRAAGGLNMPGFWDLTVHVTPARAALAQDFLFHCRISY